MEGETGGLARYLLRLPQAEEGPACPAALVGCRLLGSRETPVLWAVFRFRNPGPAQASFAGGCLARAFQEGLPLSPALVRHPGFQGQNNLLPLLPGQQTRVHLAWRLKNPARPTEIRLAALFPLPGQDWRQTVLLPAEADPGR